MYMTTVWRIKSLVDTNVPYVGTWMTSNSHTKQECGQKNDKEINNKFDKMTVTQGSVQFYLRMNLEIKNEKVHMEMKEYLIDCIYNFPENISTTAKTLATKSLTKINKNSKILDTYKHETFYSIVQKLLHVAKQARLELQVAIGFLCTCIRSPMDEDWKKLKQILQYVYETLELKRILSLDSFTDMNIFVDASHACHENMHGQTGGCINMGFRVLHARSSKQGLNSKSSTETELIGGSYYLPYAL